MIDFNEWCESVTSSVGPHPLRLLSGDPTRMATGIAQTVAIVPTHYAAEERLASILDRLGKPMAARFIEDKLPTTKSIRSGDLGEILATEFISTQSGYQVPIKRLRWKDHRNMAMRGEDVIGIHQDTQTGRLLFLKAEAKSRVALTTAVVEEARAALDKDGGLPTAHAVSYISDRLAELGNHVLADAIIDAQLKYGIQTRNVQHLQFVFTGNDPTTFLVADLQAQNGVIAQWAVGLRVHEHAAFVAAVYDTVIANANT